MSHPQPFTASSIPTNTASIIGHTILASGSGGSSCEMPPVLPRGSGSGMPPTLPTGSGSASRGAGSGMPPTLPSGFGSEMPPTLPTHPLSPALGHIIATISNLRISLDLLRSDLNKLKLDFEEFVVSNFSIECSVFKDELLIEIGTLYCNTLNRIPDQKEVILLVGRVLKTDARIKYKQKAAVTFCNSRLAELRAEERRRVFAQKPCEAYAKFSTSEFVEKFMPLLKAGVDRVPMYLHHVAMLRKFCRQDPVSTRANTFKKFGQWLAREFNGGQPTSVEFSTILLEEDAFFGISPDCPVLSPTTIGGVEDNEEEMYA